MRGLLYKDFAVVKGKIICIVLVVLWILLVTVQVGTTKDGFSEVNYLCFGAVIWMIMLLYFMCLTKIETGILAAEEGRRQKQYFLSMPIKPKDYVKSKYLFVFISYYVVWAIAALFLSTCLMGCREEPLKQMLSNVRELLPVVTGGLLFVPALEMPFFIGLGVQKGNQLKVGIIVVLFFCLMAWFLFGDLTVLDRIGLDVLFQYFQKHKTVLSTMQIVLPVSSAAVFYLSYRISVRIFCKKEWEDD